MKGIDVELAEGIALGLHSLAQPLAALQMNLEMCLTESGEPEHRRQRVVQALLETERIYHRLASLRDIVFPYRRVPKRLETRSLREALEQACSQPHQVSDAPLMELCFDPQCSPAEINACPDLIPRLALAVIAYLRCAARGVAHLVLSEWDRRIRLDVACTHPPFVRNTACLQLLERIHGCVSALEGEVQLSETAGLLRVELWKNADATTAISG